MGEHGGGLVSLSFSALLDLIPKKYSIFSIFPPSFSPLNALAVNFMTLFVPRILNQSIKFCLCDNSPVATIEGLDVLLMQLLLH